MMLTADVKVKPTLPVETIVNVPSMVSVCRSMSRVAPVNVTTTLAAMVMEHLPEGTIPPDQVALSLNEPDLTAWKTIGVDAASSIPGAET